MQGHVASVRACLAVLDREMRLLGIYDGKTKRDPKAHYAIVEGKMAGNDFTT